MPWLGEPMRIFGIAVTGEMYYLKSIPNAKLELYVADCPVTDYRSTRTKNGRRKGRNVKEKMEDFDRPAAGDVTRSAEAWQKRYGNGGKPKISSILRMPRLTPKSGGARRMTLDELRAARGCGMSDGGRSSL